MNVFQGLVAACAAGALRRYSRLVFARRSRSRAASVAYTVALSSPEQHLVEVQIVSACRHRAARTSASGLECALSGSRFRPVRELGARERSFRQSAPSAATRQEPLADFRCGGRRDCGISNLCRFARTIQRPAQYTSCIFQSGADFDVSSGRALCAYDRAFQPHSCGMAHRHSSSLILRRGIHRHELRSHWSTLPSRSANFRSPISTKPEVIFE